MFCKRGNVVKISSKVYKFRTLFASPQTFLYWNWTSLQMIKSQSQTTEKSKQNFVALIKRTNTTSGTKWKWNIFKHIYVLSKRGRMFIENCNCTFPVLPKQFWVDWLIECPEGKLETCARYQFSLNEKMSHRCEIQISWKSNKFCQLPRNLLPQSEKLSIAPLGAVERLNQTMTLLYLLKSNFCNTNLIGYKPAFVK